MLLTGHQGAIYSGKFSGDGQLLASGSHDKLILLWKVYGECENWGVLKGHSGAILDLVWSQDSLQLYSASADKTGAVWDVESAQRIKRLRDHTSYVNSICAARNSSLIVTGSDDNTAMVSDLRVRDAQHVLENEYQVLAVSFSADATQVFTGGIENDIKAWDLRTGKVLYTLTGHHDSVTGMELSPDGSYLLSYAMDHSVKIWDVRPFAPTPAHPNHNPRLVNNYEGAQHDLQKNLLKCCWSPDGSKIAAGSGDRLVYVWDVATRRILFRLPGHGGCVNEVDFHPKEPVILSVSDDKKIYLGEL